MNWGYDTNLTQYQDSITDELVAGILVIGNEVLDGLVLDTNSNWMEKQLLEITIQTRRQVTVRDEMIEIDSGLKFLLEECNVVITSGGLGPTHDDMTLSAVAASLDLDLYENERALQLVSERYQELFQQGIVDAPDLTESRMKMGMIPEGSEPLNNNVGGAPGVKLNVANATIFCLPGVPGELKSIWNESVKPWLEERIPQNYSQIVVEFPIKDETVFAPHSQEVMSKIENIWIKSMPKQYGTANALRVWISSRAENAEVAERNVQRAVNSLEKSLELESTRVES
jgi:molybdenum cofactor synthesis domain-containing protein